MHIQFVRHEVATLLLAMTRFIKLNTMNINLQPFPTLATERLTLRELNVQDAEEVFQLRSDDKVNAYIDRTPATSIQDAKDFIKKIEDNVQQMKSVYWAITLNTNKTLIGTTGYWNFDLERNIAEIGYELRSPYHGQGLMQEALKKVIAYGFEVLQLNAITAFCRVDNESSIKLLKRTGFKLDNDEPVAMYVLKRV
jgi:ribosomal-protein-alanine N-acetyltransferase